MKNKISECIIIGFAIGVYMIIGKIIGISCPIKFFTGVSCAGCGMTRAWGALLHQDVRQAFHYHPLFWAPIACVIVFLLKEKISAKRYQLVWGIVIVLALIVYIYRLADASDVIVVFEPQKSNLLRIWVWFQDNFKCRKG